MNTTQRRDALMARTATPTLIHSSVVLEMKDTLLPEERMTRAWIFDELAKRAGNTVLDREEEFESVYDATGDYLTALIAVSPALADYARPAHAVKAGETVLGKRVTHVTFSTVDQMFTYWHTAPNDKRSNRDAVIIADVVSTRQLPY